jgi:hypothetical protein
VFHLAVLGLAESAKATADRMAPDGSAERCLLLRIWIDAR